MITSRDQSLGFRHRAVIWVAAVLKVPSWPVYVTTGGQVPTSASHVQKEREEGEKGLGQLSSKGVSKELAGEFCTSHRASGKASLYSNGLDAQAKSRVSVSEERGHQILEGSQQVRLWVTVKFIS